MSATIMISVLLLFTSAIPNHSYMWLPVPAEVAHNYIEKYNSLAIDEMNRVHIPASIKLAQGMFESNFGRSSLAKQGNNHFGIKCKGDWKGEKVYFTDDKPNECFRKYGHVTESYRDHSLFLIENLRYASLFSLPITDYEGWARGLKKAGYATDPSYHNKIIQVIEKYELYQYDIIDAPLIVDAENICLELDEACVIRNANNDNDLLALLNIDANKVAKYKETNEISSDLNTIDDALQASIGKRPEDIKRKCLTGAPAILVIPDKIREDIQRNKEQKQHIAGRELNPAFQPIAHCVINAEATRSVTSVPDPSITIKSETNYATDDSKSFKNNSKIGKLKESIEDKNVQQATTTSATTVYKPHLSSKEQKDDIKRKEKANVEKEEKSIEYKPHLTDDTAPVKPAPMMPSYMKRGEVLPKRNTFYKNGVKAVSYPYEISPLQISKTYNINLQELLNFNDMLEDEVFLSYTNVYLEPKADKTEGDDKYHTVKNDETMWDISQMYGISLMELYKKNKMMAGKQPQNREKIVLKGRAASSPAIKKTHTGKHNLKIKYDINASPKELKAPKKDNLSGDLRLQKNSNNNKSQKVNVSLPATAIKKQAKSIRYKVKAQETLVKIAQKYDVTLDDLRQWNNLQHDILEAGQILKVYKK